MRAVVHPTEEQVGYSANDRARSVLHGENESEKTKILSIAERGRRRAGKLRAEAAPNEGQLTIASTGKDPAADDGNAEYTTFEGPVDESLTTTAIDIEKNSMNRCIVLTVDETAKQTRAIHDQQRENETPTDYSPDKRGANVRKLASKLATLCFVLSRRHPFAKKELRFIDDQARRRAIT